MFVHTISYTTLYILSHKNFTHTKDSSTHSLVVDKTQDTKYIIYIYIYIYIYCIIYWKLIFYWPFFLFTFVVVNLLCMNQTIHSWYEWFDRNCCAFAIYTYICQKYRTYVVLYSGYKINVLIILYWSSQNAHHLTHNIWPQYQFICLGLGSYIYSNKFSLSKTK